MARVNTKPLKNANNKANLEWAKEEAKVFGNKQVIIKLFYSYPDVTAAQTSGLIPLTNSNLTQVDELGNVVDLFEIVNNRLKLKLNKQINNVREYKLNYTAKTRRFAAGNNSARVIDVITETNVGIVNDSHEAFLGAFTENIPDTIGALLGKKRTVIIDEYDSDFIGNLANSDNINYVGYQWRNQVIGTPNIQLKFFEVVISITYYDPTSIGGN